MIFLLLVLLGLQYRLWFNQGSFAHVFALQRELTTQQAVNERLRERNSLLETEVRDLKKGDEAVEERARSELGLIKKGETFYLLVDD